jgi:hypothetical protein
MDIDLVPLNYLYVFSVKVRLYRANHIQKFYWCFEASELFILSSSHHIYCLIYSFNIISIFVYIYIINLVFELNLLFIMKANCLA